MFIDLCKMYILFYHGNLFSLFLCNILWSQCMYKSSCVCLVEGTIIIGARKGGTWPVPRLSSTVICIGKTQCAAALQLVLQTPAKERGFLRHLASLWVFIILIVCEADHGIGLGQTTAVCCTLGGL